MTIDDAADRIRFAYPQIYYACHKRHVRRRSTHTAVSDRDSQILVHLDRQRPTTLSALARHMDLAKSTLSEALSNLESLGYVTRNGRAAGDRRAVGLTLTEQGVNAVRASSVLDADRIGAALARLTPRQRAEATRGLALLAKACRGIARRIDR